MVGLVHHAGSESRLAACLQHNVVTDGHEVGWPWEEATRTPVTGVFAVIDETSRTPAENPVDRVWRDGVVAGLGSHTLLVAKDGREIPSMTVLHPVIGDLDGTALDVCIQYCIVD